jgi:5'-methylthioadenosine phosphorylase
MTEWVLGVIGGSGLYDIAGMEGQWRQIESPFGAPSDAVFDGVLHGVRVVFLPRHGRGHRVPPSAVNYRANIDALKRAGVTDVLSVSACGSFRDDLPPGTFVLIDQFIDRTCTREKSFFGPGLVAHVSMAHPICPRLAGLAAEASDAAGAPVHNGGTYLAMEGPQFSTLAESKLYRAWGCDVIGMTNMPEAKLAREAELPYASVSMVTDFDCWHEEVEAVTVTNVLEVLNANSVKAKAMIAALAKALSGTPRAPSPIDTCLDHALITAPDARDPAMLARLDAILGRVLGGA